MKFKDEREEKICVQVVWQEEGDEGEERRESDGSWRKKIYTYKYEKVTID